MLEKFENMPDSSRLWVYQFERVLDKKEQERVLQGMMPFIESWQAHGKDLKASCELKYGLFLILAVDEDMHGATGCSIDSSVNAIKKIVAEIGVDCFDRSKVAFRNGDNFIVRSLQELKSSAESGELNADSLVYNNGVADKSSFLKTWELKALDSWAKRYIV
ncbi:hypothetical protein [Aureibacter tunicatorum]|uniref:ABC transporter ATPase n=1 Tax=Aureibacter tunicatorum TaxID=866807 RepID=A0AAE4BRH5_9BACT|nr:hypothetical protein [Aureibacter tunicatorum]MDR6237943.1 hypothetical protein [Aureibacter tunicatorum]BDD02976.1 hypothetical protein AUTU_04590 [Aureibacter tunicatorum]